jgi:hypothetical protein
MLIKYSNASAGIKPNASRPTNMAYTRYFMAATYAEADKAKKRTENGQSRSLALIESL